MLQFVITLCLVNWVVNFNFALWEITLKINVSIKTDRPTCGLNQYGLKEIDFCLLENWKKKNLNGTTGWSILKQSRCARFQVSYDPKYIHYLEILRHFCLNFFKYKFHVGEKRIWIETFFFDFTRSTFFRFLLNIKFNKRIYKGGVIVNSGEHHWKHSFVVESLQLLRHSVNQSWMKYKASMESSRSACLSCGHKIVDNLYFIF